MRAISTVGIADSPRFPTRRCRNRGAQRAEWWEKGYSEEKIDRPADLADPSPGICKAAARHAVDPRFIGLSVSVCLSLPAFTKILPLSLSPDISLLRGRAGRCTSDGDFCAAETAISAPAKLNCRSRGEERMATRGPSRQSCERGTTRSAGKRIAPRRRFRRWRNRGVARG